MLGLALQRQQLPFLPQCRGDLVHDAARRTDHPVLDDLTQARQLQTIQSDAEGRVNGHHRRHLDGPRGGHTGADGDVAHEHQVGAARPGIDDLLPQQDMEAPQDISRPCRARLAGEELTGRPVGLQPASRAQVILRPTKCARIRSSAVVGDAAFMAVLP